MFSWLRRAKKQDTARPEVCKGNPGMTPTGHVAFANAGGTWSEEIRLCELTERALRQLGYDVRRHEGWLEHVDSGITILPLLAELQPLDNGGVRTVTTIQVSHPEVFPEGLFEYQHSTGDGTEASILAGATQWVQGDFVTLLDALREKPTQCMMLEMQDEVGRARVRRAILGPPSYLQERKAAVASPDMAKGEEHPFCPCCLLTHSAEAFKPLFASDQFLGVRLFAMRGENGVAGADCRINGVDYANGIEALRNYVGTWPQAGFEFRKQYVVFRTLVRPAD